MTTTQHDKDIDLRAFGPVTVYIPAASPAAVIVQHDSDVTELEMAWNALLIWCRSSGYLPPMLDDPDLECGHTVTVHFLDYR